MLGGARSGKSVYAERLIEAHAPPWTYIATAAAYDDEMRTRIAQHRGRRNSRWTTVDAPLDLPSVLAAAPAEAPLLIDCLTLWTSNLMLADRNVGAATDALLAALDNRHAPTVMVSNEVGLGIVPDNALARRFRDEAGRMNQRLAAASGRVIFIVSGLPMAIKGSLPI